MVYSRGYEVESRGAYTVWACQREKCGEKGTRRGEEHEEEATWDAASHQQNEHRDDLLKDAAGALDDAATALHGLWDTLTYADSKHYPGPTCVRPMDATSALQTWAYQMKALLPGASDWERHAAQDGMCKHETRNYTSSSWPVLAGIAEIGGRANPEVPRGN
ncbi:hypothetical protein ABZS76_33065 [Streptomyces sp. NPDC005562]|uniref:hypothetical protein n=1 Tax=Streptomyces sp. NPDC005562 TaxID=3154890 RepID=UPI0033A562BF